MTTTQPTFDPTTYSIAVSGASHLSDEQLKAIAEQHPIISTKQLAREELRARQRQKTGTTLRDMVFLPMRARLERKIADNGVELHVSVEEMRALMLLAEYGLNAMHVRTVGNLYPSTGVAGQKVDGE